MKRVISLVAWGTVAIVAALASLNWPTMMAEAPLDLVVARVQAPLGLVLLGVAGILLALFLVAWLRTQIESLLEARRLLKEIQRVQDLADKAEASRIESLHRLITSEFRVLNERLDAAAAAPRPAAAPSRMEGRPLPLSEIVANRLYP